MGDELRDNLDRLHTTALGVQRIRRNLGLGDVDVVAWCREAIAGAEAITRQGKNWYAVAGEVTITVNAHSHTIITAHRRRPPA